jgi:catechol 2,3-dioxygenase-like lactoylglutathione lyase family enzyme
MIPFVTIGAKDRAISEAFYDPVLVAIGLERQDDYERWAAWGPKGTNRNEIYVGAPFEGEQRAGNGIMIALRAPSEDAVRAAHRTGLTAGGSNEGDPGYRPADSDWYGAYLRDPAGNKICICYSPEHP